MIDPKHDMTAAEIAEFDRLRRILRRRLDERARDRAGIGEDPTRWCNACGALRQIDCHCGPLAEND
jgi:hypothetical protein